MSATRQRNVPRGIEAVLLDYGGTLDGDALHWFDHFATLYARAGTRVSPDAFKSAFYAADETLALEPGVRSYGLERMTRSHVRLQLASLGINDASLERRLADDFIADTRQAWDRNRPLLRRLATRFCLGVVSNSYGNMQTLLEQADLGPFGLVLDSAVVGLRKPDPELYLLALRRLGLPAASILHVGDSWERDVLPAYTTGMRTAWLTRSGTPPPEAPLLPPVTAVWRLASLLELEALLQ